MDHGTESKCNIPQAEKPRRFGHLVLGLRVLVISVAIAGIVVTAIPAPRTFIAIGILGPAVRSRPDPSFILSALTS
jgi:hypothetical protein